MHVLNNYLLSTHYESATILVTAVNINENKNVFILVKSLVKKT